MGGLPLSPLFVGVADLGRWCAGPWRRFPLRECTRGYAADARNGGGGGSRRWSLTTCGSASHRGAKTSLPETPPSPRAGAMRRANPANCALRANGGSCVKLPCCAHHLARVAPVRVCAGVDRRIWCGAPVVHRRPRGGQWPRRRKDWTAVARGWRRSARGCAPGRLDLHPGYDERAVSRWR